jgi:ribulose-phosphate 3-epimerase
MEKNISEKYLEDIVEAFDYFFFNYQAAPLLVVKADDLDFSREDDVQDLIQQIRDLGVRAAVALNPATPLEAVERVLIDLDMVLLMTVNPGYAGQRFIASVLPKIRDLRAALMERAPEVDLQVDGGIDERTAGPCVAAGANVLVAATAIFKGEGGIEASVRRLRSAAEPAVG